MIFVGKNWTSGGRSGKRKRGHLVEEKDEDDEDLQMLNNVP
jgi:hypothetical protein